MKSLSDRSIIKWQPFNSCFDSKDIMRDISKQRKRKEFPILSEDQILEIAEKVTKAWNLKLIIDITYYYDGEINNYRGKINYLNLQNKSLELNNHKIFFQQILKIMI